MNRKYGVKKFVPDHRDSLATPHLLAMQSHRPIITPPKFSLEEFLGPVKEQGDLGACTGFCYAGLREFLYRKYNKSEADRSVPADQFIASPMFVYYSEREAEGTVNDDSGAQMRSGCRVLNRQGVCLETQDPYAPADFKTAPSAQQSAQAMVYKAGSYHLLLNLSEMKSCLLSGYVFAMGFDVYESFEWDEIARTGIMPLPGPDEALLGGHAVLVYGYDNDQQGLLIRNSWGTGWGLGGNFVMPYAFASDAENNLSDCWILHLGRAWSSK